MVKSWRQHGGWLKDIPIYVFNVNRCKPKRKIIQALESFGCQYIEKYVEDTQRFEYGFLNEPLCGKIAEELLDEDIFIKIDLDMQLLKPLDRKLFDLGDFTLIGQYSDEDAKDQRHSFDGFIPFDTNFMISVRKSNFYHYYYETCFDKSMLNSREYKCIAEASSLPNYLQEEFAVDYMYKNQICQIKPITNYNFGEGYRDIDDMTDDEVNQIYFLHGHIYADKDEFDDNACKTKYLRRLCKIRLLEHLKG